MEWSLRVVAVMACVGLAAACGDPSPSEYPAQDVHTEDSAIGVGDKIDVRVFYGGSKEMTRSYSVRGEGTIAFPLIGRVEVAGRTQEEIEEDIQKRLADGYLQSPVVSINIIEATSKKIQVLGQVKSPGSFVYSSGMTVIEAISQAGGFTPMARKNAVTITRINGAKKKKYTVPVQSIVKNRANNFAMRPGDVVFVPERVW